MFENKDFNLSMGKQKTFFVIVNSTFIMATNFMARLNQSIYITLKMITILKKETIYDHQSILTRKTLVSLYSMVIITFEKRNVNHEFEGNLLQNTLNFRMKYQQQIICHNSIFHSSSFAKT